MKSDKNIDEASDMAVHTETSRFKNLFVESLGQFITIGRECNSGMKTIQQPPVEEIAFRSAGLTMIEGVHINQECSELICAVECASQHPAKGDIMESGLFVRNRRVE